MQRSRCEGRSAEVKVRGSRFHLAVFVVDVFLLDEVVAGEGNAVFKGESVDGHQGGPGTRTLVGKVQAKVFVRRTHLGTQSSASIE